MKFWISRIGYRCFLPLCLSVLFVCTGRAQSAENTRVDVFMGAELHYRDIFHNKIYEVLVNLTPGVKWYMGNRWQLAGQVIVPVYNDYGDRYKKVRLNMSVLSKEWDWHRKLFLKVSGGLFAMERYGLDVKWMYAATDWLALDAQAGWTGFVPWRQDGNAVRWSV